MRYRITFDEIEASEVECADLRVIGTRRVNVKGNVNEHAWVTLYFGAPIKRIANDHDRTIYDH